jgi:hypothetical protein
LDPVSKFQETTERLGYFVGFSDNVEDAFTFKIMKMIASRTSSKMHKVNVDKLSIQNLFFTLHDATLFQGHGKF